MSDHIKYIAPSTQAFNNHSLRPGDKIIEINGKTLIDADFSEANGIFCEAIRHSIQVEHRKLALKVVRILERETLSADRKKRQHQYI